MYRKAGLQYGRLLGADKTVVVWVRISQSGHPYRSFSEIFDPHRFRLAVFA